MREPYGLVALAAGALVAAEGVRTLAVFARHRDAPGKAYLGTMLTLFGVSLAFRAPEMTAVVTETTGAPNLTTFVRGVCSLGTVIGPVGLLGLGGWTWLRLRYGVAAVVAGTGALAWLAFGASLPPDKPELFGAVVWISGGVPGLAFAVFATRFAKIIRQSPSRVRRAGALSLVGSTSCAIGVAASLVAAVGGPDLTGGSVWRGLLVQSLGGMLIATGSWYAEAADLVAHFRGGVESKRVRRLWCYVEPIRQTMADRIPADGVPGREIIDIYDALLLARQQNCGRVRERASLVADAAGLGARERAEFLDAVELRSAVVRPRRPPSAVTSDRAGGLGVDLEEDPLDVDVAAQRAQVARLAQLVLRDRVVRRTA
ncbi:hypothetical protein [Amycolatopsis nivea]|uniref:hypothetical protein n=1 Tax=Amycolatopsis nivea TaxID=1644109 RepID=UPI00106FF7C5|nr:hypothetical protein [Amycolatopsis nivea]